MAINDIIILLFVFFYHSGDLRSVVEHIRVDGEDSFGSMNHNFLCIFYKALTDNLPKFDSLW